jgi:oxygen-dependent protoporphyrinogen oxidase
MTRGRRAAGRLSGFRAGGMQRLTDAIAGKLGDRLRLGCAAERVEPHEAEWRIGYAGGEMIADVVVIATPSDAAATLLETCDPSLAELLRGIPYAPMRVAGVAFRSQDVPAPLDGFGFLVARGQDVRILGALFTSTIYPRQAPADTAYLRVFLGGAADRDAVALDAGSARGIVLTDLAKTLGITAAPVAYHEAVWPQAIPQYALDHRARLARIDERVEALGGLTLAGNAYRGLGLSDNVRDALAVAGRAV